MASEIKRRFTDTEMQIVRETDLLELLTHLGYQVKRIGRYHTTAEMDSLRIKDRRTWFRYSQNTGGDAITLVQQFCDKTFPEAVEYLLTFNGRARDSPAKAVPSVKRDEVQKPFTLPPRNTDDRRVFAYYRAIQQGFEANDLPVESLEEAWNRTIDEVWSGKVDRPQKRNKVKPKGQER